MESILCKQTDVVKINNVNKQLTLKVNKYKKVNKYMIFK